ncbi:hypothetical protein FPV67DRAFT_1420260 [Lyophyllum atratum]|nr:hypothetical protein FPV67DRAFT_1420260 [Lyophyllum atratum]
MSSGKIIVVNQFTFCFEHGSELCYVCNRDYRSANNSTSNLRRHLTDKLGYAFEVMYTFDLEGRQPINVYAKGVTKATHHRGPRASGSCPDHSKLDCGKCFDWVRLVGSEVTEDNFDGVRARTVRDEYSRSGTMVGGTV